MKLINEIRTVELDGARRIVARERVLGIDARRAGMGGMFERHTPLDVEIDGRSAGEDLRFVNVGIKERLAPYVIAPVVALTVRALLRQAKRGKQ
jgi:hypothetical protein